MMFNELLHETVAVPAPADWPLWLWHLLADNWTTMVWGVLFGAVLGVAAYVWRRWVWHRAAGRGTWLEVVPPRQTAVTASTAVWRLLDSLARRATSGWHLAHPPLTMEVHGNDRGRLALTVWVPRWVPAASVATEVRRAWPGAQVQPFVPPMVSQEWKAAGFGMAAYGGDHEPLVSDVYLRSRLAAAVAVEGDPLRPVFDALREANGPTVLQVLARPAGRRRIARLALAARQPVKRRKPLPHMAVDALSSAMLALLRGLLDLLTPGGSAPRRSGPDGGQRPPDPLQRLAMRQAAEKLKAPPHLAVAIRAVALRPSKGWAVADATSLANAYRVAGSGLRPKRLWWARRAVSDRYAARGQWLMATASELGALFHLPADPARFGFTVAAMNRPFPHQAAKLRPEEPGDGEPGWSGGVWTSPPGRTTALDMRDPDDGTFLYADDNPSSEYHQYIDDDIDSDWDDK